MSDFFSPIRFLFMTEVIYECNAFMWEIFQMSENINKYSSKNHFLFYNYDALYQKRNRAVTFFFFLSFYFVMNFDYFDCFI